jgi:hypothetical protein
MRTNRLVRVYKNVKGLKVIRIELGMFDTWVRVVFGPEKKLQDYVRWADRQPNFVHDGGGEYGRLGCCLKSSGCSPIVWLPRSPRTPREHGTLAHEAIHAVFHILDWLGMEANQDTSEVVTHMTSWVVRNALEHS